MYGKDEDGSFFLDFRTKNIFIPILTVVSIAKDTKNFIFQNTSMYTNLHYNVFIELFTIVCININIHVRFIYM